MGSLLSKELLLVVYQDFKSLGPWVAQYLKPTVETVRELMESMNSLRVMMRDVVLKLVETVNNGWSPRSPVIEWIEKGLACGKDVQEILDRYMVLRDRHTGSGAEPEFMLHCPCDAVLLSRQINLEALNMIVHVNRRRREGEAYAADDYETVAKSGAIDPDALDVLRKLIPEVRKLTRFSEGVFSHRPRPCAPPQENQEEPIPHATCPVVGSSGPSSSKRRQRPKRRAMARQRLCGDIDETVWILCRRQCRRLGGDIDEMFEEKMSAVKKLEEESEDEVSPIMLALEEEENKLLEESIVLEKAEELEDKVSPIMPALEEEKKFLKESIALHMAEELEDKVSPIMPALEEEKKFLEESIAFQKAEELEDKVSPIMPALEEEMKFLKESIAFQKAEAHDEEDIEPGDVPPIEKLRLSTLSKYSAFSRSEAEDDTPVMIRLKAPSYTYGSRSPIDLVMVLDVSGRMAAEKLKQGALFVLRNLHPEDRLSVIVAFDSRTHLLFPLTYLSSEQKARARTKLAALPAVAGPCDALRTAAVEAAHQILTERAEKGSRLARIMVLTDGKAITEDVVSGDYPTYTFGVGSEHDPWKMYDAASRGHGTYSFDATTDLTSIGAAMALCVGGLTSIAAQGVEISIRSEHPGVKISRIGSGAYDHAVEQNGTLGSIIVDDVYSSEEKNFLVYVNVPKEAPGGFFPRTTKTKLLTVEARYCCPASHSSEQLDPVQVSVERKGQTQANSMADEVAGEVMRATVLEKVDEIAKGLFEKLGDVGSTSISSKLRSLREAIKDTPEAKAAKATWDGLRTDLGGMEDTETGLAYMLSWLTSHQWQRAAMPGSKSKSVFINFRTARMKNLIDSVDIAPVDMHLES